jgi:hypothetical protein
VVRVYTDQPERGGTLLGELPLAATAPFSRTTVAGTLPGSRPSAWVRVDPAGRIAERDEGNNDAAVRDLSGGVVAPPSGRRVFLPLVRR